MRNVTLSNVISHDWILLSRPVGPRGIALRLSNPASFGGRLTETFLPCVVREGRVGRITDYCGNQAGRDGNM